MRRKGGFTTKRVGENESPLSYFRTSAGSEAVRGFTTKRLSQKKDSYFSFAKERGERTPSSGFTLIELLVVIAIIGMLSSVVLASLGTARDKANDARKQADFRNIQNALFLFYDKNGRMPNNYNPCCGVGEGSGYYEQSMQELVTAGVLPGIPKSPDENKYYYYNYGPNNSVGVVLVTDLKAAPDTITGIPPSCRPWGSGINWCDQNSDKQYCLCTPY